MRKKSKSVNNKYDDGISEINLSEDDLLISEELDFGKDFTDFSACQAVDVVDNSADTQKKEEKNNNENKADHKGHRARMYHRYAENKFKGFHEHEVLEMLLYHGVARKDTNQLAHKLIEEFGCLENVLDADYYDLINAGLSERTALILTQYKELEHYLRSNKSIDKVVLANSDIAGEFCSNRFGYEPKESFYLISMKSNRKVISVNKISSGTSTSTDANVATVLKTALRHNAECVILCHNHPSGDLNPSTDDFVSTQKIVRLLESVDICVADHIICYKDRYTSLFERGTLYN